VSAFHHDDSADRELRLMIGISRRIEITQSLL
jgi:hypothetical protein